MTERTPVSFSQRELGRDEVILVREPESLMESTVRPGSDQVLWYLLTLVLGSIPRLRLLALLRELLRYHGHPHLVRGEVGEDGGDQVRSPLGQEVAGSENLLCREVLLSCPPAAPPRMRHHLELRMALQVG